MSEKLIFIDKLGGLRMEDLETGALDKLRPKYCFAVRKALQAMPDIASYLDKLEPDLIREFEWIGKVQNYYIYQEK